MSVHNDLEIDGGIANENDIQIDIETDRMMIVLLVKLMGPKREFFMFKSFFSTL